MKAAKETAIKLEAAAKTAPGTSNNAPVSYNTRMSRLSSLLRTILLVSKEALI